MNYQGRLTDTSNNPVTIATNVTFTFWDAESGGAQIGAFSDTDSVTPDSNGLYSTLIGDDPGNLVPVSVFATDAVWLNVNVGGEDLAPRRRITSASTAINAIKLDNPAFIVVATTDNATSNAAALLNAYAKAKALTPHGLALSATNRAAVIVPPGRFDLGTSQLTLDTQFVDLIGLSSSRADQFIYGTSNGPLTGVVAQTANDVRIENLLVKCTRVSGSLAADDTDPAAYFPATNLPKTVVRNCEFQDDGANHSRSMRVSITYSGTYDNCTSDEYSFGGYGTASGKFTGCTGGIASFGSNGSASGIFTGCTGGDYSFGGISGGVSSSAASGTFTDCTGGDYAFGGNLSTNSSTVSGTFTNCTGGEAAFGGNQFIGSTAVSGTFTNCIGGDNAFGGNTFGSGDTTGAQLYSCRMTGVTWDDAFNGRMQGCHWATGVTLGAAARIYNSTFLGDVDLNSTAAGVANSYIQGTIQNAGSSVFNSGNVESADVN